MPIRKPRTVIGPMTGTPRDSLTRLSTALANGNVAGVVLVIADREGVLDYSLSGSMKATDLAFAGVVLQKWATENA